MTKTSKEFQEKLAGAINAGFIRVSQDPDGILRYALTDIGAQQWQKEDPIGYNRQAAMLRHFNIQV